MGRDYLKDAITDVESERRMQDAATVLLDACIQSIPASHRGQGSPLGAAIALAVQTIYMADVLKVGKPADQREISSKEKMAYLESMPDRMRGLGLGVGHCIGTMNSPVLQAISHAMIANGIAQGVEDHRRVWEALKK